MIEWVKARWQLPLPASRLQAKRGAVRGEAPKLIGRNGPAIFAVGPVPGFVMSLLLRVALLPLGAVLYRVPIRRVVPRILCRRLVVQFNSRCAILNYHYTTINGLNLGVKFKNRFHTSATIYFLSTSVPVCHVRPENAALNALPSCVSATWRRTANMCCSKHSVGK